MKIMPLLLLGCLTGSTLGSTVALAQKSDAFIGPRQPASMATPKRLEIGAIPARLNVEQIRRQQESRNESNNQLNERATRPAQTPPRTPPSRVKTFWG